MQNFLHPDCWPIGWAVFVPLLIHLWNRKEGRTILVGSIQWIPEQEQRKINRIQFSDFWRFLVRTLMLLCLCLLILQYLWPNKEQETYSNKWILVDPQIKISNSLQLILDSLSKTKNDIRYLQAQFPKEKSTKSLNNHWALLQQLAVQNDRPDSVLIFSNLYQKDFMTSRPTLPFHIAWQPIPEEEESPILLKAWKAGGNRATLLFALPSNTSFSFVKEIIDLQEEENLALESPLPSLKIQQNSPNKWMIESSNQQVLVENQASVSIDITSISKENLYYLRSAIRAIQEYTGVKILDDSSEPDFIFQEEIAAYTTQYFSRELNSLYILQNLHYQEANDAAMVQELLPILLDSFIPAHIKQLDRRIMDTQLATSSYQAQERLSFNDQKQASRRFDSILWILLLGLFLVDRFWIGNN